MNGLNYLYTRFQITCTEIESVLRQDYDVSVVTVFTEDINNKTPLFSFGVKYSCMTRGYSYKFPRYSTPTQTIEDWGKETLKEIKNDIEEYINEK